MLICDHWFHAAFIRQSSGRKSFRQMELVQIPAKLIYVLPALFHCHFEIFCVTGMPQFLTR